MSRSSTGCICYLCVVNFVDSKPALNGISAISTTILKDIFSSIYLSVCLLTSIYLLGYHLSTRGLKLVKAKISQILQTVAIFSGIFQKLEFVKKCTTSSIFYFTVISSALFGGLNCSSLKEKVDEK